MAKLDRLGWAAGMAFTAYGVRVGVRVNRAGVLDRLIELFPFGWKPATSPIVEHLYSVIIGGTGPHPTVRRFNLLYSNLERLARTPDVAQLLETFESNVQLHVAEAARRRLFVHAGVVGWRGQAILIPGRSFSGKTTLVAELVRAGAMYYSDEYAVLDAHGRVHPYPRPLQIRENGTGRQKKFPVENLGGQLGSQPLSVGLVVVSEYKEGGRWRPRRLSAGQGVLALLAHTVSTRRQPERALPVLQQVVLHAPVLKGARGEAQEVVTAILKQVGD